MILLNVISKIATFCANRLHNDTLYIFYILFKFFLFFVKAKWRIQNYNEYVEFAQQKKK